jgi:anti-anti-sigma factor
MTMECPLQEGVSFGTFAAGAAGGRHMNSSPKVERSGNVKIITFSGERIRDHVENMIASELLGQAEGEADTHLLLDFSNVETISSVELGTLINLQKQLKAAGARLTLFNLSPLVFEVFSITRLNKYFGICREAAIGSQP